MNKERTLASQKRFVAAGMALIVALVVGMGIIHHARAQVITDVIDLGDEGGGVAVNSDTNRVYACVGSKIKVYDVQTLALITTITLPQNYTPCYDVAVNPVTNRVYAAGFRTYVINGSTNAVLKNFDKAGEEIAVNTATNRVYISERSPYPYSSPSVVHVLNGADNSWLPDIPVGTPTTFEYTHLAVNPITNLIYITFTADDYLRVLDGNTHAEITRILLENIGYVSVNPATNRVYVGKNYKDAAVLDGATNTETATISGLGWQLHVNPLTNRIYAIYPVSPGYVVRVADLTTNRVVGYVYQDGNWADFDIHLGLGKLFGAHEPYSDPWSKKMTVIQDASPTSPAPEPDPPAIIATLDLPEAGEGIAVNALTNRLYVGVDGGISIFDATTMDSLATIPLSEEPAWPPVYDVGVDEARNRIYAVTVSGTYVINGANNQVIKTLGSGNEIAVNPGNGRVYIADEAVWLGDPDVVKIYDGVGLALIRTLNLGTSSHYQTVHVAVNPTTGYAYCTYSLDGDMRIISPATDDVAQTMDYNSFGDVSVNPATNRVYVRITRSGQSGALILDGNTHAELGMIEGVSGQLEINPLTNRLYGYDGYTLFHAHDGNSGELLSWVFLDGDINDYAVHPGLSRLYVTNYDYPAEWAKKVTVIQDSGQIMAWVMTVNKTGTGTGIVSSSPPGIDCGSSCLFAFPYNTSVTLTATPASGSTFNGWSGSGCSGTGTCTVSMDAARSVTADFTYMGTYTISGNVDIGGVTLRYNDGLPRTTTSDSNGDYSITITGGWSGTITPIKVCYTFSPPSRGYTNVLADKTDQDYSATAVSCEVNFLPLVVR